MRNHIFHKIVSSFCKFVLFTALIHIAVLVFRTFKEGNFKILNYFSILDLNAFFPKITKGWVSDFLSVLIMLSIFVVFLVLSLVRKSKVEA